MTYDNWKTTNPADEFLGPEPEDDMPESVAEPVSLENRVEQFKMMELPGQPMGMHMGTLYLVDELWREVERLRAVATTAPDMLKALYQIADISEGSGTVNSLPHLAKIARAAIAKAGGRNV